jgi:hypothetical protein
MGVLIQRFFIRPSSLLHFRRISSIGSLEEGPQHTTQPASVFSFPRTFDGTIPDRELLYAPTRLISTLKMYPPPFGISAGHATRGTR